MERYEMSANMAIETRIKDEKRLNRYIPKSSLVCLTWCVSYILQTWYILNDELSMQSTCTEFVCSLTLKCLKTVLQNTGLKVYQDFSKDG